MPLPERARLRRMLSAMAFGWVRANGRKPHAIAIQRVRHRQFAVFARDLACIHSASNARSRSACALVQSRHSLGETRRSVRFARNCGIRGSLCDCGCGCGCTPSRQFGRAEPYPENWNAARIQPLPPPESPLVLPGWILTVCAARFYSAGEEDDHGARSLAACATQ